MLCSPAALNPDACYQAMLSRDARFDGQFFTAVSSTGIYCRPVCRVRVPRRENCSFFHLAAQAERAGYRPCLRCRPELAPGASLPWSIQDASSTLAQQALALLDQTSFDGDASVAQLAARLGVSERHLRRILEQHLGISPLQYRQTRRLLLAKQLLCDTALPVSRIAELSGFGSQRRFNTVFLKQYRLKPTQCRRQATRSEPPGLGLSVSLGYRKPYATEAVMQFFRLRSVPGLEQSAPADDGSSAWRRVLRVTQAGVVHRGWVSLQFDASQALLHLRLSDGLLPVLPMVMQRTRAVFDLDANPGSIEAVLGADFPGTSGWRVPGAWNGFELAVRAVLGQQISVAAARTLTQRLVHALGDRVDTPWAELSHAFPDPEQLLAASEDTLGGLGIVRQRQRAMRALAEATLANPDWLEPGRGASTSAGTANPLDALVALPGIGDWTAQYIAMRALRWPDAFPAGDIVLQSRLKVRDAPQPARAALAHAASWQPWRSYAVIRLWHGDNT